MLTRAQGLLEAARQSQSVEQLYRGCDELLMALKSDPESFEVVRASSLLAKESLGPELQMRGLPPPREAAAAGLRALASGMISGLLDGMLLYEQDEPPADFQLTVADAQLQAKADVMVQNLGDIVRVARQSWAQGDADSLQLLSGYGRHENRKSDDEAMALAASPGVPLFEFQVFLLATFKGGYAMGMADAAVVFVAGERPGQAPE
ncbi:MAG: hypothetical protein AB7S38_43180 [Vulcanimicrobiota bacterium]